jgi:putative oxidoreductase
MREVGRTSVKSRATSLFMAAFISQRHALLALRIMVGIIMMAHGFQRLYYGTVADFGGYLDSLGLMIGTPIAWSITLFELAAGATLALGFFQKWISLTWLLVIVPGIFLVHLPNGWYVVGPGTGGVEYSCLIVVCLAVLSTEKS